MWNKRGLERSTAATGLVRSAMKMSVCVMVAVFFVGPDPESPSAA